MFSLFTLRSLAPIDMLTPLYQVGGFHGQDLFFCGPHIEPSEIVTWTWGPTTSEKNNTMVSLILTISDDEEKYGGCCSSVTTMTAGQEHLGPPHGQAWSTIHNYAYMFPSKTILDPKTNIQQNSNQNYDFSTCLFCLYHLSYDISKSQPCKPQFHALEPNTLTPPKKKKKKSHP